MSFENFSTSFCAMSSVVRTFFQFRIGSIERTIVAGENVQFTVQGSIGNRRDSKYFAIKMNDITIGYFESFALFWNGSDIHNTIDYRNGGLYLRHISPDAPYMKYKLFPDDSLGPIFLDYPLSDEQYFQQSLIYDIVHHNEMDKVLAECNYTPIHPIKEFTMTARCTTDLNEIELIKKYWCRVEGEFISVLKN